jgi:WD40 repeat protein
VSAVDVSAHEPADFSSREDLAAALTVLREQSGMTVRDISRSAGLPVATAGGYFSGRHLPPLASIELFVRVLTQLGVPEAAQPAWLDALTRLRRAPGRRPATAIAPYRGLAAYQPEDAALFFGREDLTGTLVDQVAAGPTTPVVVIGPSGSGKSSLLRAGLAATLMEQGRHVVIMTPGAEPRASLERTLGPDSATAGAVVIIDQLEEIFATDQTRAQRVQFIDRIAALHDAGVVVVLGLRADFFDRVLEIDAVAGWLTANQVLVGPMSARALRRVVVDPARAAGIEVDEALVEVLLGEATSDAGSGARLEAGALPLLSHALYVTWSASSGRRLTLAQYRETGGLGGAIAQTAEEVHTSLTPEQQRVERGSILRLAHVHTRDGVADTRRAVDLQGFASPYEADVIAAYVDARLLTTDRGRVQLAHEAVLHAWPRLRSWLDADRDGLRTHGRLSEAVQQWLDANRDPELLYRGSALDTATSWVFGSAEPPALGAAEWEFLDASQAEESRKATARRRANRRLRALAAGLAVLVLSTGSLAAVAVGQNRTVSHDRNLAVSRQLAVTAQSLAATDPGVAGQVAVAALAIADTLDARSALLSASGRHPVDRIADVHAVINSLDVSPNGSVLAVGTDTGHLVVWSTGATPRQVADLSAVDGAIYRVAFSPDGALVAVGGSEGLVKVWSVADPSQPTEVAVESAGSKATVYGVTFSPDSGLLAAASADGTVTLWRSRGSAGYASVTALHAFTGTVQSVAISPTGTMLAAAGSDGLVALWDLADPSHPRPWGAPVTVAASKITSLAFNAHGTTLAAGSTDTFVHLWDVSHPEEPVAGLKLAGPASWVNDVRYNRDGTELAAAGSDKQVWVWDTATGVATQSLAHPTTLLSAVWAPDGRRLYSGAADGMVREWTEPAPVLSGFTSIPGQGVFGRALLAVATTDGVRLWDDSHPDRPVLLSLTPPPGTARLDGAIAVSDALSLVVAGDTAGSVHFWDIREPAHPIYLKSVAAHSDWVDSVSFDRSGTRMATSSDDASLTLWDLSHGVPDAPTSRVPGLGGFVYTAAFSPDGATLVASVLSGNVRILDVSDLVHPHMVGEPLTGPVGYVYSVAFSPDGRTIAASGNDKSVWLWDVTDRTRPTPLGQPLTWADGNAMNVWFSPDGHLLAAGMTDGTVRLWDVSERSAPIRWASLGGIVGTVYGVSFSLDGRYVSGAGADKTVRIWDTSLGGARTRVCASATRGITMSTTEWSQVAEDVTEPKICR